MHFTKLFFVAGNSGKILFFTRGMQVLVCALFERGTRRGMDLIHDTTHATPPEGHMSRSVSQKWFVRTFDIARFRSLLMGYTLGFVATYWTMERRESKWSAFSRPLISSTSSGFRHRAIDNGLGGETSRTHTLSNASGESGNNSSELYYVRAATDTYVP